jgi:hypothetical protein
MSVIARLDRATQYAERLEVNLDAAEYWVIRFRG